MTGEVDLDRLADYVGGALDGTPDQAALARLIATDPLWTRAHADLVAADAGVRADLAVLAAQPEPLPSDVVARLSAALDAEPPLTAPAPADPRAHLSVLPGGRATSSPVRRRWRAVAGVAAAAAVLGLGAATLAQGLRGGGPTTMASNSAGRAATPSSAGSAASLAAIDVRTSGFDYTPGMLTALGASVSARSSGSAKTESRANTLSVPEAAGRPTLVPEALRRLTDPDARAACLQSVLARYGGTAILLDYARYEGSPALVVLLAGAGGAPAQKWVVAVGPNCGTGGAITDQLYSGSVG
ncbi:hypothetical protein HC028_08170 [Planosporangium flavigriseum]|uniref:Uncharacterized protein n=1 Tax=Planosporangium flavigriseum TaxID=373681 RepID=A0A8J3PLN2_9ACTN|nr:hypothetical protein [Planosporangium flavigriseum]NJC64481.1 hypothetical protein [Planosporangium flavigriseum]GIG72041.1 hypothetical protein Pfl04_04450 [Planosporangium flavigriseum]